MKFSLSYGVLLLIFIATCRPVDNTGRTLQDYDITRPDKFYMPESLHEISGISFHRQNNDTVYAIQDEDGKLFRLAWGKKKQYHTKFARKGDYEDLAIVGEKVYILKSNGNLYSFPFSNAVYEEPEDVREWNQLLPKGEYESLYGDDAAGRIYVLCKNCAVDNKKDIVSGYILQAGDSMYQVGTFSIDVHQIKKITGKGKRGFNPSAMAKNTLNNKWYIMSAVNRMLVVTDSNWTIKEVCALGTNSFNQPEGIAFDKLGSMYISNEGDDFAEGNIMKFVLK